MLRLSVYLIVRRSGYSTLRLQEASGDGTREWGRLGISCSVLGALSCGCGCDMVRERDAEAGALRGE